MTRIRHVDGTARATIAHKGAVPRTPDGACVFCGGNPRAPIADTWSFFIEREMQSLNARLSNDGTKRWAYAADRDAWLQWMKVQRVNLRIPAAQRKRRVVIERLYGGRERPFDYGNLVGGAKSLTDAMTRAQLIVGDAPHDLEDHYQQSKTDGASGVRIWLQEFA